MIRAGAVAVALIALAQERTLSAGACLMCFNYTFGDETTGDCVSVDLGYFDCALMSTSNGSYCEDDLYGCGFGGGS